jgi:hypothetical protein
MGSAGLALILLREGTSMRMLSCLVALFTLWAAEGQGIAQQFDFGGGAEEPSPEPKEEPVAKVQRGFYVGPLFVVGKSLASGLDLSAGTGLEMVYELNMLDIYADIYGYFNVEDTVFAGLAVGADWIILPSKSFSPFIGAGAGFAMHVAGGYDFLVTPICNIDIGIELLRTSDDRLRFTPRLGIPLFEHSGGSEDSDTERHDRILVFNFMVEYLF